jgi:hypothetical protein
MVRAVWMGKIMRKTKYTSRDELSINELDFVSGGTGVPNANAVNTGVADVADPSMRKAGGGQGSGMIYLVFQFKLVAV